MQLEMRLSWESYRHPFIKSRHRAVLNWTGVTGHCFQGPGYEPQHGELCVSKFFDESTCKKYNF